MVATDEREIDGLREKWHTEFDHVAGIVEDLHHVDEAALDVRRTLRDVVDEDLVDQLRARRIGRRHQQCGEERGDVPAMLHGASPLKPELSRTAREPAGSPCQRQVS
jgi:hypothetical protein